jgi:hypothetical protein
VFCGTPCHCDRRGLAIRPSQDAAGIVVETVAITTAAVAL